MSIYLGMIFIRLLNIHMGVEGHRGALGLDKRRLNWAGAWCGVWRRPGSVIGGQSVEYPGHHHRKEMVGENGYWGPILHVAIAMFNCQIFPSQNHFGSLTGGHYTAACFNPSTKQFYNFDDHEIKAVPQRQVKSSAAYLLFYTSMELSVPKVLWTMQTSLAAYIATRVHFYSLLCNCLFACIYLLCMVLIKRYASQNKSYV
jgi:hypothetical protein